MAVFLATVLWCAINALFILVPFRRGIAPAIGLKLSSFLFDTRTLDNRYGCLIDPDVFILAAHMRFDRRFIDLDAIEQTIGNALFLESGMLFDRRFHLNIKIVQLGTG